MRQRSNLKARVTVITNEFIDEYMPTANGEYVKVYLYLLRHEERPVEIAEIADALNHTEADVKRALGYWEKAGVLVRGSESEQRQGTAMPDNQGQGDSAPPGSSQGAQPGGEAASGSVSGGDGQEAGAPGSVSAESGQGDSAPIQPSGEPIIEEAVPETGAAEAEETVAADSPAETDAGEGDQKEEHPPIDYAAAAANGYQIYEVGDGETLYGICWSLYGDLKHLNEIIKMNYLENENRIFAGQRLIVP